MQNSQVQKIIEHYPTSHIVNTLIPFLTERRKHRINEVLEHRLSSIQLVIEEPCDINNAFAILRTCECFGIQTLHIIKPEGATASLRRLTRGAMYWVDIKQYDTFEQFAASISTQQCLLAGGVLDATQSITEIPVENPLYLLLGNEQKGLSEIARQTCHQSFRIPMCGMSDSLNLSASAAICLYEISQRKRNLLQKKGDLDVKTQQVLTARYYLNSVNGRLTQGLLPLTLTGQQV